MSRVTCSMCTPDRRGNHQPGCPRGGGGGRAGRKTPEMCKATHAPTGTSPHTHVCMENKGHGGKHICGVPTSRSPMCGYSW